MRTCVQQTLPLRTTSSRQRQSRDHACTTSVILERSPPTLSPPFLLRGRGTGRAGLQPSGWWAGVGWGVRGPAPQVDDKPHRQCHGPSLSRVCGTCRTAAQTLAQAYSLCTSLVPCSAALQPHRKAHLDQPSSRCPSCPTTTRQDAPLHKAPPTVRCALWHLQGCAATKCGRSVSAAH